MASRTVIPRSDLFSSYRIGLTIDALISLCVSTIRTQDRSLVGTIALQTRSKPEVISAGRGYNADVLEIDVSLNRREARIHWRFIHFVPPPSISADRTNFPCVRRALDAASAVISRNFQGPRLHASWDTEIDQSPSIILLTFDYDRSIFATCVHRPGFTNHSRLFPSRSTAIGSCVLHGMASTCVQDARRCT